VHTEPPSGGRVLMVVSTGYRSRHRWSAARVGDLGRVVGRAAPADAGSGPRDLLLASRLGSCGPDGATLFVPQRLPGGHRRYSRYQLHLAQRTRDLVYQVIALDAACASSSFKTNGPNAQRINARLQQRVAASVEQD
jgi:hypothetical protein